MRLQHHFSLFARIRRRPLLLDYNRRLLAVVVLLRAHVACLFADRGRRHELPAKRAVGVGRAKRGRAHDARGGALASMETQTAHRSSEFATAIDGATRDDVVVYVDAFERDGVVGLVGCVDGEGGVCEAEVGGGPFVAPEAGAAAADPAYAQGVGAVGLTGEFGGEAGEGWDCCRVCCWCCGGDGCHGCEGRGGRHGGEGGSSGGDWSCCGRLDR